MDLISAAGVASLLGDRKDVLLGVSGGIDSMAMLGWFAANRARIGRNVRAMHVDHGINPDSGSWARFVADRCRDLEVSCEIKKVSLDGRGNNLEYAARQARYQAFCESGCDALVLAHHANDQCESFLLKLFRGSGVKGLKAMSPSAPCWYDHRVEIIRPMLSVTRDQIVEWAEANGITGIEDPSNLDSSYDRNYIRNKVWPVIKDRFDIADINTVRSIQHLAESWELTTMLADNDIEACTITPGVLDWRKMRDMGVLRVKNMILRILDIQNVYGFSVNHVEQFAHGLISADLDSRNELSLRGFSMNKVGKRIHVGKNQQRAA